LGTVVAVTPPRRLLALLAILALLVAACAEDWPRLGRDATHSGVSAETQITAENAADLTVAFAGNLGHESYASPVVAWAPTIAKRLVIAGTNAGTIMAFDTSTDRLVWNVQTGGSVVSTATVLDGVAYVGSNDGNLYALDLATGRVDCKYATGGQIQASPAVGDPDGSGTVVYFGDVGNSGGDDGGHFWAVNGVDPNGATDCSLKWSYNAFGSPPGTQPLVGSWSPPALTEDANGRSVVLFGSSSPEGAVYSLDAVTGQRVWRYLTVPAFDGDVGGGITVSPPGTNGFAHGLAYFIGKDWIAYALDLTTGAVVWQFDVKADSPGLPGALRNTPAFDGRRVYFGYPAGVYALDAKTGAKAWKTTDRGVTTAEVFSSPVLTGPAENRIIVVGDQGGTAWAFRASDGMKLWSHPTEGSILSSAAVSGGRVYLTDTDRTLYGFATSVPATAPDTAIAHPTDRQSVANPNGSFTIDGLAVDDDAVGAVTVAVRDVNADTWWNRATNGWGRLPVENPATVASPGGAATAWSIPFPIPYNGGTFEVRARTLDTAQDPDPSPATARFFVESLGAPAKATITTPATDKRTFIIPGGSDSAFDISVGGTATDTGGTKPGVAQVVLSVRNVEHAEYFCGAPLCNGYGWSYVGGPTTYQATLGSPNAVTTTWSSTVQVYGHPHTYVVTAWAIDRDGQVQQARPSVTFCTNFTVESCPITF
jgi:outer membrane protein assembly factor BamB